MPRVLVQASFDEVRFQCQRCGSCCHHRRPQEFGDLVPLDRLKELWDKSNMIYLTKEEIENIRERTRLMPGEFVDTRYKYDGRLVRVEDRGRKVILDFPVMKSKSDSTCIFYQEGCRVYPDRPRACRLFPFRVEEETTPLGDILLNISYNPSCPGIGKGSIVDKGAMEQLVTDQFIARAKAVALEVQRLREEGRISEDTKVYRAMPGPKG